MVSSRDRPWLEVKTRTYRGGNRGRDILSRTEVTSSQLDNKIGVFYSCRRRGRVIALKANIYLESLIRLKRWWACGKLGGYLKFSVGLFRGSIGQQAVAQFLRNLLGLLAPAT